MDINAHKQVHIQTAPIQIIQQLDLIMSHSYQFTLYIVLRKVVK